MDMDADMDMGHGHGRENETEKGHGMVRRESKTWRTQRRCLCSGLKKEG